MAKKKRQVRADFRKNRSVRARDKNWTQGADSTEDAREDVASHESIRGKGELSRKRVVADAEVIDDAAGTTVLPAIDPSICRLGRVLRVQGLVSIVQLNDGS